jgi:hypothetical protein
MGISNHAVTILDSNAAEAATATGIEKTERAAVMDVS